MKNLTFRKQLTIAVFCAVILTGCVLLGFLIDRSIAANNLFAKILSILSPFIAGGIIAFVLKPLCNLLDKPIGAFFVKKVFRRSLERGTTTERRVLKRADNVSILLSVLIFILILAGLLVAVIPQLYDSIVRLINSIPGWIESFADWLTGIIGDENVELNESIIEQLNKISNGLINWLTNAVAPTLADLTSADLASIFAKLSPIVSGTFSVGKMIVTALLNTVVSVVVVVYTLANRKKFAKQGVLLINAIFPDKWSRILLDEFSYANKVFSGFISGRMLDSLLVGVLIFVVTTIFGVPQAILISILMGMSQLIPFFGPYIGAVPSCLIVLMIDPIKVIYFLILVVIIQQLDANIFDPLIVGNSIEMSSFWVLFSVVLFGGLFGFPGLLIGVPTFTILYDIIRKLTDFLLSKRGKAEMAEDYRRHYHNPSDDPDLLREKARKYRRDRRHTREEQKRITELVSEAQESGTTEASIPVMTVIDETATPEETAPEATREPAETADPALEAASGADQASDAVSVENPSPAPTEKETSPEAEADAPAANDAQTDAPADAETSPSKTE